MRAAWYERFPPSSGAGIFAVKRAGSEPNALGAAQHSRATAVYQTYCWVKTGLLAFGTGLAVVTSIFFFFFFTSPDAADFSGVTVSPLALMGFFLALATLVVLSVVFPPGCKAWCSFFFFCTLSPAACTLAPLRRVFFAGGCCGPSEKLVMNETPSSRRPGGNSEGPGERSCEEPNNPKPCHLGWGL